MTALPFLTPGKNGIYLNIHAQPGAKQAALRGLHGNAVKIAVKEAPQDGKANKAIEAFVAKSLAVSKASVNVVSGHTSRSKRLFINGDSSILVQDVCYWLECS